MKRTITALIFAGLLSVGLQAGAQDASSMPPSHLTPQQKQFLTDCMTKAKAANNGMSEQDMKKSCMDQLKASMDKPADPVTPAH